MDKTARIWDVATGEPLTEPLAHDKIVKHAEFSPDGKTVLTASYDGSARLWDSQSGKALGAPLQHSDKVISAHFSPDGSRVVTASFDQTARVWNAKSGQPTGKPLLHGWWVWSACFSPDGRRVATISQDRTARVWDADSGAPVTPPLVHENLPTAVQFSPDGKYIITAANDEAARIWDASTGNLVTEPLRHAGRITSAQFSPDGQRVLTGSLDGTARLWDSHIGLPLSEPLRHGSKVLTAQFTPDGKKVLTVSSDGSMKIWEARSFPTPAPDWLAPLAEAVGGQRLDDHGMTVTVAFGEIVEWKKKIMARPGHDSYAAWAQWFFADRGRRKTAPFSEIPVSDYIDSLVQENTFASLQEALWLSPTNGLALARYAKALANEGTNTTAAEVDFLTRCALQFAPGSAEVVAIRENLGGTNILTNPALAGLSLRGSSDSKPGANVINKAAVSLKPILLNPSEIPFRLPPRNPTAAPALIDLSAFYNADPATGWTDGDPKNALGTIPRGVQAFREHSV